VRKGRPEDRQGGAVPGHANGGAPRKVTAQKSRPLLPFGHEAAKIPAAASRQGASFSTRDAEKRSSPASTRSVGGFRQVDQ